MYIRFWLSVIVLWIYEFQLSVLEFWIGIGCDILGLWIGEFQNFQNFLIKLSFFVGIHFELILNRSGFHFEFYWMGFPFRFYQIRSSQIFIRLGEDDGWMIDGGWWMVYSI
ncbi:hypothetical protein C1646_812951 [Rhizophagus diaphanus]|nr:hypothetical protein C1646_812951 [Rhizophagus diaphanus] [Rhizophagus sp. MUCL 43196]